MGYINITARIRGQKLKYTLRSDPIHLPKEGEPKLLSIPLDLTFECEYLHHLKVPFTVCVVVVVFFICILYFKIFMRIVFGNYKLY